MADDSRVEKSEDFGKDEAGVVRRWQAEWKAADTYFEDYHARADKAVQRYRDESDAGKEQRRGPTSRSYNVFWSTQKTLQPLVYSKIPKSEIQRKFKDADQMARDAAELLERVCDNIVDIEAFDDAMVAARDDYLLAGRGTTWWRYVPVYGDPLKGDDEQPVLDEETGNPLREVVSERVEIDYVHYKAFRHQPAPTWSKVMWVGREELMTRAQLVKRFGDRGKDAPLSRTVSGMKKDEAAKYGDVFQRAAVREIWDKEKREVIWIAEGLNDKWLDKKPDPLGLEGFFPCPRPLFGTLTTDSTCPVPDHHEWRHQLGELDTLTERISLLTAAVKVSGFYNAAMGDEITDLFSSKLENRLFPVENWAMFQESGGFKGNVAFLPLGEIVQALVALTEKRESLKQDFFEISGVADIMRGQSDPRETMGAQRIKARYGAIRVEDRQAAMQKFVRANLRIAAEIAGEHFSPDTLAAMSNWIHAGRQDAQATFDAAMQIIKSDKLRGFRIDIETDSTISPDRIAEQEARTKFLGAVTPFLERAIPAAQQMPALGGLLSQLLMYAVRGFAAGRPVEEAFEQAIADMEAQGPGASPQSQMEGAKLQLEQRKVEAEIAEGQAKIEIDRGKLQLEAAKLQMEASKFDGAADGEMAQRLAEAERALQEKAADLAIRQAELDLKRQQAEAAMAKDMQECEIKAQEFQMRRDDMDWKNRFSMVQAAMQQGLEPEELGAADEARQSLQGAVTAIAEGQQAQAQALAQLAQAQQQQADTMIGALNTLSEAMQQLAAATTAPRKVVRDDDGRIVGAEVSVQ